MPGRQDVHAWRKGGYGMWILLAEAVGFEPTRRFRLTVFKTAAFNHSATPPDINCPRAGNSG